VHTAVMVGGTDITARLNVKVVRGICVLMIVSNCIMKLCVFVIDCSWFEVWRANSCGDRQCQSQVRHGALYLMHRQ
jgi:hypothetical protein